MSNARQDGMVLITVIWALTIIGLVVAAFFAQSLLETGFRQEQSAEAASRAAAEAQIAIFTRRFAADADEIDRPDEAWLLKGAPDPFSLPDGSRADATVSDYGSRVNLNLADENTLLALFGQEREPVDSILDWRDRDDDPRAGGAEAGYYNALNPPVQPANSAFTSLDEVLLVKGLEIFRDLVETETGIYGRMNPNLVSPEGFVQMLIAAGLPDWEAERIGDEFGTAKAAALQQGKVPFKTADDLKQLPSVTFLTLERLGPYLTFKGQVNPNLATERQLQMALAVFGAASKAKAILEAREAAPFQNLDALNALLSAGQPGPFSRDWLEQVFTFETYLAEITATGHAGGAAYRIDAIAERYLPESGSREWRVRLVYWREGPLNGEETPAAEPGSMPEETPPPEEAGGA